MSGISIFAQVTGAETYSCTTTTFDVLASEGVLSNPIFVLPPMVEPNVPVTGLIATFSNSDSSPNLSDFTATIAWGDGMESAGVVSFGSQAGTVSVSAPPEGHTYPKKHKAYSVKVSVNLAEVIPPHQSLTATDVITVAGSISHPHP
jgi:hypothetical protein